MERYFPNEYTRTVERAFASAPFRLEYRPYPPGTSANPGIWQLMHQSNGAIISTGATPAACIASLTRMAEQMSGIRSGLPSLGEAMQ
jgi:hypothetical protein